MPSQGDINQAERTLRQLVWQALDYDMLESAAFSCERLLALDPLNRDSIHLMGLVRYRQGNYKASANITADHTVHNGCCFIYAKSCLVLKLYAQGIEALEQGHSSWIKRNSPGSSSDLERSYEPDSFIMNALLGELYKLQGDKQNAVKSLASSAKINPYMWEPVRLMIDIGANLQAKNIFKMDYFRNRNGGSNSADDPFAAIPISKPLFKTSQNFLKTKEVFTNTPTNIHNNASADHHHDAFSTPSDGSRRQLYSQQQQQQQQQQQPHHHSHALPLAPQKRTARNFSSDSRPPSFEPPTRRQMRPTTTAKRTVGQPHAGSTATSTSNSSAGAASSTSTNITGTHSKFDRESEREGDRYICDLYRKLASAYIAFSRFECDKSMKLLDQLPSEQRDTPWVLSKVARLHFEKVSYTEAEQVFQQLRAMDPCRTADMDYYSTLLWHLRKEVELGYLAHELIDVDRTTPQAWCALGNCFSLQRDADQALKCFKRAVQLAPDSPYAYTLQAHEHIANDAYENAQESFRLAIRADNRHYNAWYGLGMVFMRLGNIDLAELHFSRASAINPCNVVLICCMGMVSERRKRYDEALEHFKRACELQPKSALSRYKKARTLLQLKRYDAALIEFDMLKNLAPNEASVHYLLGQLYKMLQSRDLAVKHFTIALNLDPKGAHLIKECLENLANVEDSDSEQ